MNNIKLKIITPSNLLICYNDRSTVVLGGADAGSEDGDTQTHGAQGDMSQKLFKLKI